jgi:serine/threonine-protein kinase
VRWQRLEALWEAVQPLSEVERSAFFDANLADDPALRAELESLLSSADRAEAFFDRFAHRVDAGVYEAVMQSLMQEMQSGLTGRYTLERELGYGGMATVFLAHDVRHDRHVALKVLHPEIGAALGAERFEQEIRLVAQLTHPHILPLLDSGTVLVEGATRRIWYTMPYISGDTLRRRLEREHKLSVAEATRITRDVADALDYAHRQGFVHCDIKPENILLQDDHALVADFGIARAISPGVQSRLTATGIRLGTPAYMSPEQMTGGQPLDARSDVFSLGCVLYEMVTGTPPSAAGIVARPTTTGIEPVLARALARAPADRFTSAREFAAALHAVPTGTAQTTGRSPTRLRRAISALAALVIIALTIWAVWLRPRVGTTGRPPVIAVLPFENQGLADDEYFAAGMTDEITSRLGAVSGLGVVPSRAAQRYARSSMTMREIGNALKLDYLLVGGVRRDGRSKDARNVRVYLELIRASDERQLWSSTYDRVLDDIFDVQSDIAAAVIERLGVTLVAGERSRLKAKPTENREAYTLYLKGRYYWNKRTEEDTRLGLDYFQQAVDLDPSYSLAWVGIADTWIFRGWYSRLAPRETFPQAKHAALRALEFDSTLAEAHTSLAHIHLEFDHDWKAAEREYLRAIELKPTYAGGHQWYGGFLSAMGRHEEALQEARIAQSLDPLAPIIQTWVGLRYYFARKYDQAIPELLKALELDRNFAPAHWHLGMVYEQTGRVQESIAEAERALAIDGGTLPYLASLGHAYARAGRTKDARAILDRLATEATRRHVSAYHTAVIHIALGDTNAGLDWLQRAYEEESPWIGYMNVDPRLDAVRTHPRFQAILKRAQLP